MTRIIIQAKIWQNILKKEAETELCRRKDLKSQDIFRFIRKILTHFNTAAVIC